MVAEQNSVTPSPSPSGLDFKFVFGLWTLDFGLWTWTWIVIINFLYNFDAEKIENCPKQIKHFQALNLVEL